MGAPDSAVGKCERCGEDHALIACPYVKAVDYDVAGKIIRVEFLTPADYHPMKGIAANSAGVVDNDYPKLGGEKKVDA